jgi:hypothetical protein
VPSDRKVIQANVWRAGERETVEVVATATERPPYEAYAVIVGATQIIALGLGRRVTWSLGAAAVNDLLQAGYSALTAQANQLAER